MSDSRSDKSSSGALQPNDSLISASVMKPLLWTDCPCVHDTSDGCSKARHHSQLRFDFMENILVCLSVRASHNYFCAEQPEMFQSGCFRAESKVHPKEKV